MRIHVPDQPSGRLPDAWRACVGTGRFELALRRDYQDSLAVIQRDIGFRHIRGHGLLSDGMGVYRPYEWPEGVRGVRHSFTYVDQVVDAYLELGIRPFLELGFMPSELASGQQTVFWWHGHGSCFRSKCGGRRNLQGRQFHPGLRARPGDRGGHVLGAAGHGEGDRQRGSGGQRPAQLRPPGQ